MENIMIVGHTHNPGRVGDWYHNSGSWSDLGFDVLTIDGKGMVGYHTFADGALRPVEPPILQ